jgi:hypothetical protein
MLPALGLWREFWEFETHDPHILGLRHQRSWHGATQRYNLPVLWPEWASCERYMEDQQQGFHPDFDVRLRASADHHEYALTGFDLLRDECWRNRDGLSDDQARHDRPCSHRER